MAYRPGDEALKTRTGRLRRRRLVIFLTIAVVICAGGVAVFLATATRHVKVVVVLTTNHAGQRAVPRPSITTANGEPAAPLAPSPQSVGAAAAAAARRPGNVPPTSSSPLAAGASASFARFASTLPGHIELAVAPVGAGHAQVLGEDTPAHGWSTTKVPVLVALLKARGSQGLSSAERGWAQAAITASDNQSVLDLFGDLERMKGGLSAASNYVQAVLRSSGDGETVVATAPPPPGAATTFGQTEWSPSAAVTFFRALAGGCLLSATQTSYVLDLMENIEPSESWGLGSAGFESIAFKGGWGPEPSGGYLVRQSGIVDPGTAHAVAVAIVASPSGSGSGSFATGTNVLTKTATWLRHELRPTPATATQCRAK